MQSISPAATSPPSGARWSATVSRNLSGSGATGCSRSAAATRAFVAPLRHGRLPARLARLAAARPRRRRLAEPGREGAGPAISVVVPVHGQWDRPRPPRGAGCPEPARRPLRGGDRRQRGARSPPPLRLPGNARLVPAPGPGSYAARNAGAAAARGGLLVFTDADCLPDPGWLAALAAAADAAPGRCWPARCGCSPRPSPMSSRSTTSSAASRRRAMWRAAMRRPPISRYRLRSSPPWAASIPPGDQGRRRLLPPRRPRRAPLRLVPEATVSHPCRSDWAELATKARRIKGGRSCRPLAAAHRLGPAHPLPALHRHPRLPRRPPPWRHRLLAVAVRFRLWGVELAEAGRLALGGVPERR